MLSLDFYLTQHDQHIGPDRLPQCLSSLERIRITNRGQIELLAYSIDTRTIDQRDARHLVQLGNHRLGNT
ncbi:MAG: hypothetical protein PVH19_06150 [Planctomycetia bacterium]